MSRTLRLVAFLVGAAVLALLIREVGVDTLLNGARTVGWLAGCDIRKRQPVSHPHGADNG